MAEATIPWAEHQDRLSSLAFAKADAWARSVKGTPYGSTTPTVVAPRPIPEPGLFDEIEAGR